MAKMAFTRSGPQDLWIVHPGGGLIYPLAMEAISVHWEDGTIHNIASAAKTISGGRPNLALGAVAVFFIKGRIQVYAAPVNTDIATLVPDGDWGIDAWIDTNGGDSWQQF